MRIHTSLTEQDIRAAGRLAGVEFERLTVHGSRKRPRAFDVILTGGSIHANHWTRSGEYRAATWDQWGVFLGALYRQDSAMDCGAYVNAEHFAWSTHGRYGGAEFEPCKLHKWDALTESWRESGAAKCRKCGAVKRWLTSYRTWDDYRNNSAMSYSSELELMLTPYASDGEYERRYLAEISS